MLVDFNHRQIVRKPNTRRNVPGRRSEESGFGFSRVISLQRMEECALRAPSWLDKKALGYGWLTYAQDRPSYLLNNNKQSNIRGMSYPLARCFASICYR